MTFCQAADVAGTGDEAQYRAFPVQRRACWVSRRTVGMVRAAKAPGGYQGSEKSQ